MEMSTPLPARVRAISVFAGYTIAVTAGMIILQLFGITHMSGIWLLAPAAIYGAIRTVSDAALILMVRAMIWIHQHTES